MVGRSPLVRGRRPRRPAGALHDADTVGPAAGRGRPARTRGPPHHLPSRRGRSVFHEVSRAERPSQQSRKTNPGSRSRKPGTDGTASEFPAKGAGNPWQSRQSPEGTVAGGAVFHEVSRGEGPFKQRRKNSGAAGLRPAGKLKHAPPKASIFHELSLAAGPFTPRSRPTINGTLPTTADMYGNERHMASNRPRFPPAPRLDRAGGCRGGCPFDLRTAGRHAGSDGAGFRHG